jgi:hypothetical protein
MGKMYNAIVSHRFCIRFCIRFHSFLFISKAIKKDPSRIAPQGVMSFFPIVGHSVALLFHASMAGPSVCHQPASIVAMHVGHTTRVRLPAG